MNWGLAFVVAFLLSVLAGLHRRSLPAAGTVSLLVPVPLALAIYAAVADGCVPRRATADHCHDGGDLLTVSLLWLAWVAAILAGVHCGRRARRWS